MPLLAEPTGEQARELRLVLDYQHAHRVHCGRRAKSHGALIVLSSRVRSHVPCSTCREREKRGRIRRTLRFAHGRQRGQPAADGRDRGCLLVLLAAEGVTLLAIRPLVSAHVFIGMLLLPPVALKLAPPAIALPATTPATGRTASTVLRTRSLRLLGPVVVLSTSALFATGVALVVLGPQGGAVLGLHKASFVVWLAAMAAHVLAHVLRVPRLASADWRRETPSRAPQCVAGSWQDRS